MGMPAAFMLGWLLGLGLLHQLSQLPSTVGSAGMMVAGGLLVLAWARARGPSQGGVGSRVRPGVPPGEGPAELAAGRAGDTVAELATDPATGLSVECADDCADEWVDEWVDERTLGPWWSMGGVAGPAALLALALLAGLLLGLGSGSWRADARLQERLTPALEGQELNVEAEVLGLPQAVQGFGGQPGWRLVLGLSPLPGQVLPAGAPRQVLALGYPAPGQSPWRACERWQLRVKLQRAPGLANPHGFDQTLWMLEQDLQARAQIRPGPQRRLAEARWHCLAHWREAWRDRLGLTLSRTATEPGLTGDASPAPSGDRTVDSRSGPGLLIALSLGDQAAIPAQDWQVYRDTGVAHLVAISGMHITLLAWVLAALAGRVWRTQEWLCLACPAPQAGAWLGALAATAYAVFAGWGVPAQRTVWMLLGLTALQQGAREWPWPLCLLAAAWGVTLVDPWAVCQPGFWLSFGAVGLLMSQGIATRERTQLTPPDEVVDAVSDVEQAGASPSDWQGSPKEGRNARRHEQRNGQRNEKRGEQRDGQHRDVREEVQEVPGDRTRQEPRPAGGHEEGQPPAVKDGDNFAERGIDWGDVCRDARGDDQDDRRGSAKGVGMAVGMEGGTEAANEAAHDAANDAVDDVSIDVSIDVGKDVGKAGVPPPGWKAPSALTVVASIAALAREQVVVTLGLAPLTLLLFQQLSLVGLLANLVSIPLVSYVLTPLSLAGIVWPGLWSLAAWLAEHWLHVLTLMAGWPSAVLSLPVAPVWAQAAGLLGALLLVLPLPRSLRLAGLPMLLGLLWPAVPLTPAGRFELLAADVGQGTAVLVRTRTHLLLYDAGPRWGGGADAGQRVLLPLMRALGWTALDAVVISHQDLDHVGGAAAVLRQHEPALLLSSLPPGHPLRRGLPDDAAASTLIMARDGPMRHRPCERGQRWRWDGVHFEILHPGPLPAEAPRTKAAGRPNHRSCVLQITDAAGRRALLTGDIEAPDEAEMLAQGQVLPAEVLVLPHHGSRTSSTPALIAAVAPRLALAQAGYRHRFGHPHPAVLARFAAAGIPVWQSAGCGAWRWLSGEPRPRCERDRAPRYWDELALAPPPVTGSEARPSERWPLEATRAAQAASRASAAVPSARAPHVPMAPLKPEGLLVPQAPEAPPWPEIVDVHGSAG